MVLPSNVLTHMRIEFQYKPLYFKMCVRACLYCMYREIRAFKKMKIKHGFCIAMIIWLAIRESFVSIRELISQQKCMHNLKRVQPISAYVYYA